MWQTTETTLSAEDLAALHPLSREIPNIDAANAEIARFSAELTLPRATIHVISDIHGEDKKLRHLINNASGSLRSLVERLFKDRMTPAELQKFLTLIFYPGQVVDGLRQSMPDVSEQRAFAMSNLHDMFEIVRFLASRRSFKHSVRVFPDEYRQIFIEILYAPSVERDHGYVEALVDALVTRGRIFQFIHLTGRVIRNLAIDEIIIAGDCWDRGPRGDRVMDYLMSQPNVSFIWGNHDMAWLGACLGHEVLIAHVLRVSLRYRRMLQLEEGYGISFAPLEHLARTVYGDDPASSFIIKGSGIRETSHLARMQKAAAIIQFKLEGQMIERNPEWGIAHRRLLHTIDLEKGTVVVDGVTHPLNDTNFPTLDPADPYRLTAEEAACMARLRTSFMSSQSLWAQMVWMVNKGRMFLVRDENLIFHGCLPVDEEGNFLPMHVGGKPYTGKALMKAIEQAVYRLMDGHAPPKALDLLWYLWCGAVSPLFGKDRIATLEQALINDKHIHHETKNPYFSLLHEKWFCERVLAEFGVDRPDGLIVNGHVPVALDKGENPMKRSGMAVVIDGAFSEAYGDRGLTLVIEPRRTILATHHHFESVEAAISEGADIIPKVDLIRQREAPIRVSESRRGEHLRYLIGNLEKLIAAYRSRDLAERV